MGGVAIEHWGVSVADLSGVVEDDDLSGEVLDSARGLVLGVGSDVATLDVLDRQVGQEAYAQKTKKEEKDEEVITDLHTRHEYHLYTNATRLRVGRPPAASLQAIAVVVENEASPRRTRAPLMTGPRQRLPALC